MIGPRTFQVLASFGVAVALSLHVVCQAIAQDLPAGGFFVSPPVVALQGNMARAQLVVTQRDASGRFHAGSKDLTRTAQYHSSDAKVAEINAQGRVLARGNGQAYLRIVLGETTREIPVTVEGVVEKPTVDFVGQVTPILNKAGCNMAACHAAQHGKGGFKLSVFGYDPSADWSAMVRDRIGRRVDFIDPANSLVLKKPAMQTAHGGGQRIKADSTDYQLLKAWLECGAPKPRSDAPQVVRLAVTPWGRLTQEGDTQQLRVEATYSDGTSRDVSNWAKYDSMDDSVLAVTTDGFVTVVGRGQATIMVRFQGQVEIATFVSPYADTVPLAEWKNQNFIDELAASKFRELGIEPSGLCDDATFIRRAMLDAVGTLPKPEQVVEFIESDDPEKRTKLVDQLLGLTGDPAQDVYNDQYAAYWTLKWSDLIRNSSTKLGDQGMWAMHNWIRESFRVNKPFDQFVRELITAKGSIYMNGPANYFRINSGSTDLTESTAQLFLGIRMECAKCHHHPFEKYSQADYYAFAAFFSRVGTKNSEEFGLFGRETVVMVRSSGEVSHPRTRKVMQPTPLEGEPLDHPLDRRIVLGEWMTAPDNPFFARSVVNRYMGYLLGYGLVEPIDDMRFTNPPSNRALLDGLAGDFVAHQFDLKHLIKKILTSRLYQLQSQPTEANAAAGRYYSSFKVKRLPAEPLLDAVDQACGAATKFKNLPPGTRAIELPDAEYPNYFLNTFAKPRRASVCECERTPDENLAQALHTLNGDTLAGKIASGTGRVARLLNAQKPHEEIVKELYLATVSRYPSQAELDASRQFLAESPSPKEYYEDLLWALINSKQFLFVR